MRRAAWLAPLLAAAVASAEGPTLAQSAAQAYREGRYMDALRDMAAVLDQDPENAAAKNYVWTIARKMAQADAKATLKPGELEKAARLAATDLQERRRRAEDTLAALRNASRRSDNPRGPADLLAGVEGLDKQLGPEFEAERADAQARAYLANILKRLSAAIDKRAFVSSKDFFRAQGYLAYYQNDWEKTLEWWDKAAREDPEDGRLKEDIKSLRDLVSRKKEEKALQDLAHQAATYANTGYPQEAYEAWRAILARRPDFPGAREKALVARVALQKSRQAAELRRRTDEGVVEFKAGRHLKAAQIWLEVLQADPAYDQARTWLKLVGPRLEEDRTPSPPVSASASTPAAGPKPAHGAADPAKAEEIYKKGLLLYSDEKLPEAVRCWREALRLDPSLAKARQALEHAEKELAFR
jgi:tetratricopeptide (TPR) repeat protein